MIKVAIDVGPLHGPMTGVGRAVEGMTTGLGRHRDAVEISPYVVSYRADLLAGTRRLPYPAGLAIKFWSHFDFPLVDRHLPEAQIVHGMNYVVPPTRRPRVVTVYDCWAILNPQQCPPVINHAMKALRRSITTGAVVHASSQSTADIILELFPTARIEMIHLGAPSHRAVAGDELRPAALADLSTAPFIVAIGTAERRKNYPILLAAFAAIARSLPEIHLVIAGAPGDDTPKLQQLVADFPAEIKNRIRVIGRVSDDNIAWLHQHATVMAYPSLDEGFGFPLLEAMSVQLPIVASTRGSIPEVAGDAALLVDALDVDALARALSTAVSDSSVRNDMRAAAIKQHQLFSWEKTTVKLLDLYADLVIHA